MDCRYAIIPFLILLQWMLNAVEVYGQERRPFSGYVIDGSNGEPLIRATVRSGKYSRKTQRDGSFSIDIVRGERLIVSSVGYQERRINYNRIKRVDSLTVYLSPSITQWSNIDRAAHTETVYEKDFENVLDHAIIGDTLFVLAYMDYQIGNQYNEGLYMHNTLTLMRFGRELNRLTLPDGVKGLFVDVFNRVWVIGEKFSLRLKLEGDTHYFAEEDLNYFKSQVESLGGGKDEGLFCSEVLPVIPEVNYHIRVPGADSTRNMRRIRNEAYFKNVPGDYRMLGPEALARADFLEEKHGIPAALFAPYIRTEMDENYQDMRSMVGDPELLNPYPKPRAQAFSVGERIIIFDLLNAWIYHHDSFGHAIDSVQMTHHEFDHERYRGLIHDRSTGALYALHTKSGTVFLRLIDPFTGAAGRPFKLGNPFPSSVRVHEGWVYYVYRQPESKQFRTLYREKLPRSLAFTRNR